MSEENNIKKNTREEILNKIKKGMESKPIASYLLNRGNFSIKDFNNGINVDMIKSHSVKNQKGGVKKIVKKNYRNKKIENVFIPKRDNEKLTSLLNKSENYVLNFPEKGSFNSGMAIHPDGDKYIFVYRPDEYRFVGCFVDKSFQKITNYFKFNILNCADPKLIWHKDKLYMIYSSTNGVRFDEEYMSGSIIMDLSVSKNFIQTKEFRISPKELSSRQKNWMPFINNDDLYFISSICPHVIYKFINEKTDPKKICYNNWKSPWMFEEFLRGNAPIIQLENGDYLGIFHTVVTKNKLHYYDNGCYVFEGKPPFIVKRCSDKTYMKAEDATYPHYRKRGSILVNFPVGMIRDGEDIYISYGENDSIVKVMKVKVEDMLNLTVEI